MGWAWCLLHFALTRSAEVGAIVSGCGGEARRLQAYQILGRRGIQLSASAVRATVAETLRIGKTACHLRNFTASPTSRARGPRPPSFDGAESLLPCCRRSYSALWESHTELKHDLEPADVRFSPQLQSSRPSLPRANASNAPPSGLNTGIGSKENGGMHNLRPRTTLLTLSIGLAITLGAAGLSGCHRAIPPAAIPDNSGPDPADVNQAPVNGSEPQAPTPAAVAAPGRVLGVRSEAAPRQAQGQYASPPDQNQPYPQQNYSPQQQQDSPQQGYPSDQNYSNDQNYQYNAPGYYGDQQEDAGQQAIEEADQPPPPLPEYEQPEAPAPNYLWTPGYWSYAPVGYYWVPGVWCAPPYYGALWTPPYWGFFAGRYLFHHGFWGRHIGFYGGVNYGFGYTGSGYHGGYWNGRNFYYNRAVNRVDTTNITNVYNRTVIINNNSRVSYNGGRGGVAYRPQPAEVAAMRAPRIAPMTSQVQVRQEASQNRAQFYNQNKGRPALVAAPRPIVADQKLQRPNPGAPTSVQTAPGQQGTKPGQPNFRPGQPATRPGQPQTQPTQPTPRPGLPQAPAQPQTRPVQPAPSPIHNDLRPAQPQIHPVPSQPQPAQPQTRPNPSQPRPVQSQRPLQPQPQYRPAPQPQTKPVQPQFRPAPQPQTQTRPVQQTQPQFRPTPQSQPQTRPVQQPQSRLAPQPQTTPVQPQFRPAPQPQTRPVQPQPQFRPAPQPQSRPVQPQAPSRPAPQPQTRTAPAARPEPK